jgi:FKBP12-rapamycin complex-associated protein
MMNYLDKLIPLVIDNFQEQSSSIKRNVALDTLYQLVENTGTVLPLNYTFIF